MSLQEVITTDWNVAADNLYGDDKILKVYGNNFVNSKKYFDYYGLDFGSAGHERAPEILGL